MRDPTTGLGISNSEKKSHLNVFFYNQKVESIVVTEVTVRSHFITLTSQNPRHFLDMEESS